MTPKVAVVTRTRNRPALIGRAMDSVLGQTFSDWIHVIVNDGGDEAPVRQALEARSKRYAGRAELLTTDGLHGMEAASNAGLAASASTYVTIHDDDDSWETAFLERTIALLEHRGSSSRTQGVITRANRIDESIENGVVRRLGRSDYDFNDTLVSFFRMAANNTFAPIQFLYRRSVLESLCGYREDLPPLADWEFNLRFLKSYDIEVISERLANYHFRPRDLASAYSNTVVGGIDIHRSRNLSLRNEWLRNDLAQGTLGLGLLSAFSLALSGLEERTGPAYEALRLQLEQATRENQNLTLAVEKMRRAREGLPVRS
jgi:glycosyltransferase involved in cell wall biosynthesis